MHSLHTLQLINMEIENKSLCITVGIHQDFRRKVVVSIRKYDKEHSTPTNEGVVFSLTEWEELKDQINSVDQKIGEELKNIRPEYLRQNAVIENGDEMGIKNELGALCQNMIDIEDCLRESQMMWG